MHSDLSIAKSIITHNPRVSIVILDNIVELNLFDLIQDNAMFDYLDARKKDAKYRLGLYANFSEKVKYAVQKR